MLCSFIISKFGVVERNLNELKLINEHDIRRKSVLLFLINMVQDLVRLPFLPAEINQLKVLCECSKPVRTLGKTRLYHLPRTIIAPPDFGVTETELVCIHPIDNSGERFL